MTENWPVIEGFLIGISIGAVFFFFAGRQALETHAYLDSKYGK